MTIPIPTRFSEAEIELLDRLVEQGIGDSRSAVIRSGLHHLADVVERARTGNVIADSYQQHPQSADDDALALASAMAITAAEPW